MKILKAYETIYRYNKTSRVKYWALGMLIVVVIVLFLPWTQNIRARGMVTTQRQEDRPQQLNSVIPGKIVKWYVMEGDFVKQGDTIVQISEIKEEYLDPQLIDRTAEQLSAKQKGIGFYENKLRAADAQMNALSGNRSAKQLQLENKIRQLKRKLVSDSVEAVAAANDLKITEKQYRRQQAMYDSGLVSLTQLEQRNQAYQNALAKQISADNKFSITRQELTIAEIEKEALNQEYNEKLSKVQGEQFQSMSQLAGNQAEVAKLKNQYSNYSIRSGMYFIRAPQDGQIVRAAKAGLGEIIKESELIAEIIPNPSNYVVELFIEPMDMPLIARNQKVRFLFDGFPAIVFSGWPKASYGTFSGEVVAIENALSPNGKFRILVREDTSDTKKWPEQLRIGTGASGIALLKNVSVWYELWRRINGFPPDYYLPEQVEKKK